MLVSASLHSAIRRFLPYTISLTVMLIPCSQYSIFRKFFGKVHEIKFWLMKANFIAFSCFFLYFQSEKANCLGRVVNLRLEGGTSLHAKRGMEALGGMIQTLLLFWGSLEITVLFTKLESFYPCNTFNNMEIFDLKLNTSSFPPSLFTVSTITESLLTGYTKEGIKWL